MRYLERRKTGPFRRRQRFARLLAPAAVCALLIAYDVHFLLAWDPYYHGASAVAPVIASGGVLALNFFILRLLIYLWFEVKWVFMADLLRRVPVFLAPAVLFAVPFVPPLLALKGYTIHQARSFQRRFPTSRYSRYLRDAPPACRFEDSRRLYGLYQRTSGQDNEIRVVRSRRGLEDFVQQARAAIHKEAAMRLEQADASARDKIMAEARERETAALHGIIDDRLVATIEGSHAQRLEFRVAGRRLLVAYTTVADPGLLKVSSSADRGATWSPPKECEPTDALLRHSSLITVRHIRIRASDAFVGGLDGVSLASLRPSQIVETADLLHFVAFRKNGLFLARFDKRTETWWRPLQAKRKMVDELSAETDRMLGRADRPATGMPLLGLGARPAGKSDSGSELGRQSQALRQARTRLAASVQRLAELQETYGADQTKLELVEQKLFSIEERLEAMGRAPRPSAPTRLAADTLGLAHALRTMNRARDGAAFVRDETEAVNFVMDDLESSLTSAEGKLAENRKRMQEPKRGVNDIITRMLERADALPPGERARAAYHAGLLHYQRWRKLETARREIMMQMRGPATVNIERLRRRLTEAERRLALARRHVSAVRDLIKLIERRLDLPLMPLPADEADREAGVTIAYGPPQEGVTPIVVRYMKPAGKDEPGGRAPRVPAFLISRDNGETWRSLPSDSKPRMRWWKGRTYLFGTTQGGEDLFDRIVLGSRFYFRPAALGLSLLVCFAVCTGLAFLSAVVCNPRVWWQFLILRKLSVVLVNAVASVPAIIVLIAVFVGLAAGGVAGESYPLAIVLAIVITQIPNAYNYIHATISEYKSSERMAHDLSIGHGWLSIIVNKIILGRCLRIYIIQAFYILGYVILFETTLSYLGFTPPTDVDSWGKLLVKEGRLPMTRFLQTHQAGANDWVFWAPLVWTLLTIYVANRIGRLLTDSLMARRTGQVE